MTMPCLNVPMCLAVSVCLCVYLVDTVFAIIIDAYYYLPRVNAVIDNVSTVAE